MEHQYKLLIVDDENEILNVYQNYFAKRGFEVEVAHDGVEGLDKLRHGDFEVAIVDIRMPKMDGITLARKVQEEGIDTNVIILTGHGDREEAVSAINARVEAWFDKGNIKMDELRAKVEDLAQPIPLDDIRRILSAIPE